MIPNGTDVFASLNDALKYVGFTSGLYLNESLVSFQKHSIWPSILNLIPLSLGIIGLIFNILALLIFTASKTFRESSFRCYIYAFVLVNCTTILTYSWLYFILYIVDPVHACKYIQYFQQSLSTTSLWIMVLLSLERSYTFIRPYSVKQFLKSRTICFILLFVTCLCFIMHIDELISVDIKGFRWVNFAYGLCSIKRHLGITKDRTKILIHSHSFILPFVLNSILDIYICYQICQRRKRLIKSTPSLFQNTRGRRSKVSLANEITLTLLWQSLWLLITYFPTHLYYSLISFKLIDDHDRDNSIIVFSIRLNLLIYLAFSPTLYVIFSPTLRKELYNHICQSYKQGPQTDSTYLSSASRTFERLFSHHYKPARLTVLITRSEELPRKFPSTSTPPKPIQYSNKHESKSAICLPTYVDDYEFQRYIKTERSSTLFE